MNKLPIVAICGRPNVGKSTLFNVLVGKRISIVDPTSGVTRDRISYITNIEDYTFELIDTGGIGVIDNQDLEGNITYQINIAIDTANVIIFMVDIRDGITPLDKKVAEILRKYKASKKIIFVANKTDYNQLEEEKFQFEKLGFGSPLCISTAHNYNISLLKEKIVENLKDIVIDKEKIEKEPEIKIAIVGKPNVGKSTFVNAVAKEDRVIVSEIPGTTRDSIDVRFEKDGKVIIVIDTAGLKKRKNIKDSIDFYSQTRAKKAIKRADVVILMLDAIQEVTKTDKNIAQFILEEYKPVIIAINKWDLAHKKAYTSQYQEYIEKVLPFLDFAPICFITAKTGKNVYSTIDLARSLYKQAKKEVNTSYLNRIIEKIITKKSPPFYKGKQGKIYYATQIGTLPPTFLLFINSLKYFNLTYRKYINNQLQKLLGFEEVPIKLEFKERKKDKN